MERGSVGRGEPVRGAPPCDLGIGPARRVHESTNGKSVTFTSQKMPIGGLLGSRPIQTLLAPGDAYHSTAAVLSAVDTIASTCAASIEISSVGTAGEWPLKLVKLGADAPSKRRVLLTFGMHDVSANTLPPAATSSATWLPSATDPTSSSPQRWNRLKRWSRTRARAPPPSARSSRERRSRSMPRDERGVEKSAPP